MLGASEVRGLKYTSTILQSLRDDPGDGVLHRRRGVATHEGRRGLQSTDPTRLLLIRLLIRSQLATRNSPAWSAGTRDVDVVGLEELLVLLPPVNL